MKKVVVIGPESTGKSTLCQQLAQHYGTTWCPEFAREHKLFNYAFNKKNGDWEIETREFRAVKEKLLFSITNFGQPFIAVVDGNFENRGELLLKHRHEGVDLRHDYMRDTLRNLQGMWSRPVALVTRIDNSTTLVRFDGDSFNEREIESEP